MWSFSYISCANLNQTSIYAEKGLFGKQAVFRFFLFRAFCLFLMVLLFDLQVVLHDCCENNLYRALSVVYKISLLALWINPRPSMYRAWDVPTATVKIQKRSRRVILQRTQHADAENASTAANATQPTSTLKLSSSWSERRMENSSASTLTR